MPTAVTTAAPAVMPKNIPNPLPIVPNKPPPMPNARDRAAAPLPSKLFPTEPTHPTNFKTLPKAHLAANAATPNPAAITTCLTFSSQASLVPLSPSIGASGSLETNVFLIVLGSHLESGLSGSEGVPVNL